MEKESEDRYRHGECRCCLERGRHREILEEYNFNGVREVYYDMFKDTFNLLLSRSTLLPTLLCARCVTRLRDARALRAQAQDSERLLAARDQIQMLFVDDSPMLDTKQEEPVKVEPENDPEECEVIEAGELPLELQEDECTEIQSEPEASNDVELDEDHSHNNVEHTATNEQNGDNSYYVETDDEIDASKIVQNALSEILLMESRRDTEDQRDIQRNQAKRFQAHDIPVHDFHEAPEQCLVNNQPATVSSNPEAEQTVPAAEPCCVTSKAPTIPRTATVGETLKDPLVSVDAASKSYNHIVNLQESNFQTTVLRRIGNVEHNQSTILQALSVITTQIDALLKRSDNGPQTVHEKTRTSYLGFEPIDNNESLQNFEDALKDKNAFDTYKAKLSVVCGTGKGRGGNNCFALIDIMFTRRFLTECSWAGGSRDESREKICFKAHNRAINLFFAVIYQSDTTFTMLQCETFFKNILRHSAKRNTAKMLRTSAPKVRLKNNNKGMGKKAKIASDPAIDNVHPIHEVAFPAPGRSSESSDDN